jgi:class 3 adenylate cyclase
VVDPMTSGHLVEVREPGRVPLRVLVGERLPIGRSGDGLLLASERVSRQHCELRSDGERLTVSDVGSSNGTLVNGEAVTGTHVLVPGDRVQIGDTEILVEPSGEPGSEAPLAPDIAAESDDPAQAGAAPVVSDELRAAVVDGRITVVASEVADAAEINERVGDEVWGDLVARADEVFRLQLERYSGTEVPVGGDETALTFPTADHGALFAVAVQRELARVRMEAPNFDVHVRMGVHTGQEVDDDASLDRQAGLAATVMAAAGPDEILVSAPVRDLAAPSSDLSVGDPRALPLPGDGADEPLTVLPLAWQ